MNLYILRHGIAEEPRPSLPDARRVLTPEGRRKLRKIGKAMGIMGLRFDVILSSPLERATGTAEIVGRALRCGDRLSLSPALRPGAPEQQVLQTLAGLPGGIEDVLLVGHEPDLSRLISRLSFGAPNAHIRLKKGGLCKLESAGQPAAGRATLEWLLTPRQLLTIASGQTRE